jgi:VWFA-related protein
LAFVRVHHADGQVEISQVPPQATVSSEPIVLQATAPPEGLIHLDVAATDRAGRPFSGLGAKDLSLLDNGVPQKIVSFEASSKATDENERLTEVVLVLDEINLSPVQFELVKEETIKFLRQNGGHLAQLASVYWFTTTGLYASAKPTADGNALAEDVAQHRSPRELWKVSPNRDFQKTAESERVRLWYRDLQTVYSIAIERRDKPGRKVLVWLGLGWPARGPLEHGDTAFESLVELSTRIREARLVISQVTTWSDSLISNFDYTDYIAGLRTLSDLKKSDPDDRAAHFALPGWRFRAVGLSWTIRPASRALLDKV